MAGIYLHVPFCKQACHYCDFHFSTNTEIRKDLVHAMGEEISLQRNYLQGEPLQTVYFGGGTPSLLDKKELEFLLKTIYRIHKVSAAAEITLETNPDDLSHSKLVDLRSLGINRLSIGIQSFDDEILRYLNRIHFAATAIRSVELALETGFDNISIDLIYAIPGLTTEAWKRNIARAIQLQPQHISAYTLTIEEKTAFGKWFAQGKLIPVDETLAAEQLELLMSELSSAGYRQYEISNFARPGYESRHNSSYWKGAKYLGIGPSAHSYNQTTRQYNASNNHLYVRSIKEGKIPAEKEVLKKGDHINDYILTTLRTDIGCNLSVLKRDFDYDLLSLHSGYLHELQNHNLISVEDDHLKLTEAGRLLADKISSDLFLIE
ncbi:MAG: radical SAM family heme chaperone HemW [Cyclobacteriaceae bacterium]